MLGAGLGVVDSGFSAGLRVGLSAGSSGGSGSSGSTGGCCGSSGSDGSDDDIYWCTLLRLCL